MAASRWLISSVRSGEEIALTFGDDTPVRHSGVPGPKPDSIARIAFHAGVGLPPPALDVSVHRHPWQSARDASGPHSRATEAPLVTIRASATLTTALWRCRLQPDVSSGNGYHSDHHSGRLVRASTQCWIAAKAPLAVYSSLTSPLSLVRLEASTAMKPPPCLCSSQYSMTSSERWSTVPHGPCRLDGGLADSGVEHRSTTKYGPPIRASGLTDFTAS